MRGPWGVVGLLVLPVLALPAFGPTHGPRPEPAQAARPEPGAAPAPAPAFTPAPLPRRGTAQAAAGSGAPALPVPFGPGEEAKYQLKLGIFSVGQARIAVARVEDVRGRPSYALEMDMQGRYLFARLDDSYRSWMDTGTLASRRYIRDVHQVSYKSRREFEIYPEERRWERADNDEAGPTLSPFPLDDLAFIYYVRTLPLREGDTYTLNRYYKDDGNPVVVEVVRKDRVTVPAGTFNTVVVRPTIQTSGLFSDGGRAEIHFSDDEARHVVYLRSSIPLVGSVTLHLTSVQEGRPLGGRPGAAPQRAGAAGR